MSKIKRYDSLPRVTKIPEGGTNGATLGVNLRDSSGRIIQPSEVLNPADTGSRPVAATIWRLIREVPANIVKVAALAGAGFTTRDDDGEWHQRTLQHGEGIDVTNGDGVAGDPSIALADLPNSGVGTAVYKTTRDAKGRTSGQVEATTTDVPEGLNQYFTTERAQDAVGAALDGTGDVPLSYDDASGTISAALAPAVQDSLALADSAVQPGDNVSALVNDAGYVERTADNVFTGANQFDRGIGIGVAPNEIDGVFVNMVVDADAGDPTGIYTSMIAGSAGVLTASRNLYGTYGGATSAITYANSGGAGTPVFPVTTGLRAEAYSANTPATDWSYITNGVDALAVNRSAAAAVGSVNALKGEASDTAGAVGGLSMTGISGSISQTSTTAVYDNLFAIDCSVSSAGPVVDSYALRITCFANPNQTGTRYGLSINGVEQNYLQGWTLFDDFTPSTSPSTGAAVINGGLGVGGSVNVGFNVTAGGEIRSGNYIIPNAHNAYSLGLSFLAWTEVFAQNPVISPSDARLKSEVREPAPAEIAAFALIARLPSVWQWLHRMDVEGDAARLHAGPTVQAAMAIMEAHGLDWRRYSCFCHDAWTDQYDDDGQLLAAAGDRYSFRREELLWWVVRAQCAQLDALEGRVAALEGRAAPVSESSDSTPG